MYTKKFLAALAAAFLFVSSGDADGLYSKGSSVLQVDDKSYDKLIAKSNMISIVEFYAPWCGHCKSLKPAYEKAAKSLKHLAQVAAVNCDDENNKAFCGSMGVQGFPTLKLVKPSKKPGKPTVEDYQGPRTASGIVEAVKAAIPNHVKRISDKGLDAWLKDSNDTAKAMLFSDKGTTGALIKVLASEFQGRLSFAQLRDKDTSAVSTFGITTYPTLIVLPGGTEPATTYEGPMTKERMKLFLNQFASLAPITDSPPSKKQKPMKKGSARSSSDSSAFSEASASHASAEASSAAGTASTITVEEVTPPTSSPDPIATPEDAPTPAAMPDLAPPLESLESQIDLDMKCLAPKSSTCILALLPSGSEDSDAIPPEYATKALSSLSTLVEKHKQRGSKLFPFYAIPGSNTGGISLRDTLGLDGIEKLEIVAINWRRGWFRRFSGEEYSEMAVEGWIDGIRLGEGKKEQIPRWGKEEDEKKAGEPASGTAEEPAPEPVAEPMDEAAEESISENVEEAAPEPIAEPIDDATREPVGTASETGTGTGMGEKTVEEQIEEKLEELREKKEKGESMTHGEL